MKFIVDAQLPERLARFIRKEGFEVLHTNDFPLRDRTPDSEIRKIAAVESSIVISKDSDFLESHLLTGQPARLLLISTGNIVNRELIHLFEENWAEIAAKFSNYDFLELTNDELIAHE